MPLAAYSFLFAQEAKGEGPAFNVSGSVEFEANTHFKQVDPRSETDNNAQDNKWFHDYSSTFDLLFQVKFNDKWSAEAAISADGDGTAPGFSYDGAFIQYQMKDNIAIKAGNFTYSEGAFRYYDYDDPGDAAAGMAERSVRGIEVDAYGLTVGIGFGADDDDCEASDAGCTTYDVHAAYDFRSEAMPFAPILTTRVIRSKTATACVPALRQISFLEMSQTSKLSMACIPMRFRKTLPR